MNFYGSIQTLFGDKAEHKNFLQSDFISLILGQNQIGSSRYISIGNKSCICYFANSFIFDADMDHMVDIISSYIAGFTFEKV